MTGRTAKRLITVLGASGLLGTAITRELAGRPVRLRLVGRRPTTVPADCRAEVETRTVDLTTDGELADAVAGADTVIHLVAHIAGPGTWRVSAGDRVAERVNLGLVSELVAALRAQRRRTPPVVVFAGSMSQVGRATRQLIDGSEPDEPLTGYDRQKLAAERILEVATAEGVLRGVTLRLATLFGQGTDPIHLDRGVVAAMTRRAVAGLPLTMWHEGTVKRDLLCVDDAARAFVAAVDRAPQLAGRHWLVGTGRATSVRELFTIVSERVSAATGEPAVPVVSVAPPEHSMPTDLLDFVLDPSAFVGASGWEPRVSLREALERVAVAFAKDAAG